MGVRKNYFYKLNNKWLYPRMKMYSLYKRDLWGAITLRRRYKYRKVVYRLLRHRQRVGKRITEEIYKGIQVKIKKRGFSNLVHMTKMRLTEYYHNIKEYQYGLFGRKAYRQRGAWASNFWALLEFRLDTLLVKCNFFNNQVSARQYIKFNNILVNGRCIRYGSFVCTVGDIIMVGQVPVLHPYLDSYTFDKYYKGYYITDLFPHFLIMLREFVGGLWVILNAFNIFKKIIKKSSFFSAYSVASVTREEVSSPLKIEYHNTKYNYVSVLLKGLLKRRVVSTRKKKSKRLNFQIFEHLLLLHLRIQAYRSFAAYSFFNFWYWRNRYWRLNRQRRRANIIRTLLKRGNFYLKLKKNSYGDSFSQKALLFYQRSGFIVKTGASFFFKRQQPFLSNADIKSIVRFRIAKRFKFLKKLNVNDNNKKHLSVLFRYYWFKFYLKFLFTMDRKLLDTWLRGFFYDFFKDFKFFMLYNSAVELSSHKNIFMLVEGRYSLANKDYLFRFFASTFTVFLESLKKKKVALLLDLDMYFFFFSELFNFLNFIVNLTLDVFYVFVKKFKVYMEFFSKFLILKRRVVLDVLGVRVMKTFLFGFSNFLYFFTKRRSLSLHRQFLFYKTKVLSEQVHYRLAFTNRWNFYFISTYFINNMRMSFFVNDVVPVVIDYAGTGKPHYVVSRIIDPLFSLRLQRFSLFYNYFSLPFIKVLSFALVKFLKKRVVLKNKHITKRGPSSRKKHFVLESVLNKKFKRDTRYFLRNVVSYFSNKKRAEVLGSVFFKSTQRMRTFNERLFFFYKTNFINFFFFSCRVGLSVDFVYLYVYFLNTLLYSWLFKRRNLGFVSYFLTNNVKTFYNFLGSSRVSLLPSIITKQSMFSFFRLFGVNMLLKNNFIYEKTLIQDFVVSDSLSKSFNTEIITKLTFYMLILLFSLHDYVISTVDIVVVLKKKFDLFNYFSSVHKTFYYFFGSVFFRGIFFTRRQLKVRYSSLCKERHTNIINIKDASLFLFVTGMVSLVDETVRSKKRNFFGKMKLASIKFRRHVKYKKKGKKQFTAFQENMLSLAREKSFIKRGQKYLFIKGYPAYFMVSFKLMSIVVVRKPSVNMLSYPFFVRPEYLIYSFRRRLFF